MRPFEFSEATRALSGHYPEAEPLISALQASSQTELRAIICQWLSEGVPYVFGAQPVLYEAARSYLADYLGLHPKEITLVGSARIGYSLAPLPSYGRAFSRDSDLDLAAISRTLFESCGGAFDRWLEDYTAGRVSPRNPSEGGHWRDNSLRVPRNLQRGFIDHWKIPFWDRYPEAQAIQEGVQRLGRKLRMSKDAPLFTRASLRIYRDWRAFENQMRLNLGAVIEHARAR